MKHHRLLTLLVVLVATMAVWATPRSYQDALAIARKHAAQLGATIENLADSSAAVQRRKALGASLSQNVFLFTHAADKGFTLISRDDQMPALVAYADRGSFNGARLSDGFRFFLQAYNAFVADVQRGEAQAVRRLDELKAVRDNGKAGNVAVSPLTNTLWGQNPPYNDMCPLVNGQRTVTGCVATAMAQILVATHQRRPLQATIPAYTTSTHHISIPEVPAGATYDWDNMLAYYADGRYNEAQAAAVAKLMYHVGVANQMDYGPTASGAGSPVTAFVKYFGFDPDLVQQVQRTSYSLEQWYGIIDSELQARRPVFVSGRNSAGGHAFMCDGADGQGLYHINWGWDGYQNGYFDMAVLNPATGGTGSWAATDGYVRSLSMTVGLVPDNHVKDEPLYAPESSPLSLMWSSDFSIEPGSYFRSAGKFTFKVNTSIANPTLQDRTFDWAIGIRTADGAYVPISDVRTGVTLPAMTEEGSVFNYTNVAFTCSYAMPEGHYALYGIVREAGERSWNALGNLYGVLLPEVDVDQFVLKQVPYQDRLSATLIPQGAMVHGKEGAFVLTLTNHSPNQFLGTVNICLSDRSDKTNGRLAQVRYQCLQAYESITVPVGLVLGTSGNEYVWVTAGDNTLVEPLLVEEEDPRVPRLTLVGITTNETNLMGGLTVAGRGIAIPYIDDDRALITCHVRNDGYAAAGSFGFHATNPFTGEVKRVWQLTKELAGDGTVTPIQFSVPASVATSGCVMVYFYGTDEEVPLTYGYEQCIHYVDNIYDDSDVYRPGKGYYLYAITGNPTGILTPADASGAAPELMVSAQPGRLVVTAHRARSVDVFGIQGQRMATVQCAAGVPQTICLPPGLYVVDGRKVAVRP